MKKLISITILACMVVACVCGCSDTASTNSTATEVPQTQQTDSTTQPPSTEPPTTAPFDVTSAYAQKPYTNDFALDRIDELQYIDEKSLYNLCSIDESPIFYDDFFYENNVFNVTLDTYSYDMDNETVRQYFDTYEYSKFASMGALRVVDSFVYDDADSNKLIYYCYYTMTYWSENENPDTMDYYRDVITVDKSTASINLQERIAMVTNLEVPKEITGDHDFHNVI